MQIAKNTVVSLHYEMLDSNNTVVDKTEEPISYLHGGYDGIFPLVEEALHDKKAGDKVDVLLTPDDAFGDYEAELVRAEPMDVFPDDVEMSIGMVFEADDPDTGDVLLFRVTDIADGKVMVDANHPPAGQTIRFIATVTDVKAASAEEISHGHAHGAHGHQH